MPYDQTSSERLAQAGAYIRAHADEITTLWEQVSVRDQPSASAEQREELRNELPEFLEQFGSWLETDRKTPAVHYAEEHGKQRWRLGWSLQALIRDYIILRRVIAVLLSRHLQISAEEMAEISTTLDTAITQSAMTYVDHSERELRERNTQLRRSNEELRRFANVIAHEIRNPLAALSLAARRLRESGAMKANGELDAIMAVIERSALTINEVIDDLLQYAKLESDAVADPEPVDLNDVFKRAMANVELAIDNSGAEISADRLPTITGHRVALVQLFQNLIENAIKYAGERRPKLHISVQVNEDDVTLEFKDNGIGISRKLHKRIFRFLGRAHPQLNIPGSGIGLAICKRVADQHNGEIRVESEEGKGSTFIVTLRKEPQT